MLDGFSGNEQLTGNVRIGQPLREHLEDFALSRRQTSRMGARGRPAHTWQMFCAELQELVSGVADCRICAEVKKDFYRARFRGEVALHQCFGAFVGAAELCPKVSRFFPISSHHS